MKIVVLDGYTLNPGDLSWKELEKYGEYTVYDRTDDEDIVARAKDADIVVVNKTPLTKETMEQLPNLIFVAVLATGYNIVDTEYASSRKIPVSNIPSYSTEAVAQLVFAYILKFANNVVLHSDSVHNEDWATSKDFAYWKTPLFELSGKTLGIIGYGSIGRQVAKIAKAFNMKVLANSRHLTAGSDENAEFTDKDTIISSSDFVCIHTPLTPDTKEMVNEQFISKMKPTAYLINPARGGVIDENAVAQALNSGRIAGAAVDVLSTEPPKKDNPMLTAKNCIITPHIAWAPYETRQRLMDIFIQNVGAFCGGNPINTVNKF